MAKKYKCPYCNNRLIRKDLINHIDEEHEELIPDNFESAQVVFDLVNGTKGAGSAEFVVVLQNGILVLNVMMFFVRILDVNRR